MNRTEQNRKTWIDIGKGISMVIVILFHAENKLGNNTEIIPYIIPPTMNFFFFLSGYLYSKSDKIEIKKKANQLFRRILIPYIIFTTIIFIPKMISRDEDVSFLSYFNSVFLGQASWFVMALLVGQLLMIPISYMKKSYMILSGVLCYITYVILTKYIEFQPFQFMEGLRSIIFLVLGYILSKNQIIEKKYFSNSILALSTIVFVGVFLLTINITATHNAYTINHINTLIASFCGLCIFTRISKFIDGANVKSLNRPLEYTGVNSLIFYFLNGGLLTILVVINNKLLNFSPTYLFVISTTVIATIILAIISKFIVLYVPFIVGQRKRS